MYFNLKSAQIYKAIIFYKLFPARLLKFLRIAFFILAILGLGIYGFNQFQLDKDIPTLTVNNTGFGLLLIFLPLGFSILFLEIFGRSLKEPAVRQNDNYAELLDFDSACIFAAALSLSRAFKEDKVSTDCLLAAILENKSMAEAFIRLGVKEGLMEKVLGELNRPPVSGEEVSFFSGASNLSQELNNILAEADKLMIEHGGSKISSLDLIAPLFGYNQVFKKAMLELGLDGEDLKELGFWYEKIWDFRKKMQEFWSLENLLRKPPIGRDWTYGYSWYLNHYAVNLNDQALGAQAVFELASHQKEIMAVEQVLAKTMEANVLLVGPEGVGKRNVIMDFVGMIERGEALPALNYKKVFELNVSALATSESSVEVQNNLVRLLNEAARAGNIILVIENFHNFVGGKSGLGRIDISEIIIPFLESSNIQVIATTAPADFHKFLANRGEFMKVFDKIDIDEPDKAETLRILEEAVPAVEAKAKILVTYGAIKNIVESSDKFIRSRPFPKKALNLLSEVASYANSSGKRIITSEDIDEIVSKKTDIPIGPLKGGEREMLANLEKFMHEKVIGQERAVKVVASAMRRLRAGLAKRGKPAGVFLFVGPTGVGKTLTSKVLAETYFGSQDKMLRFDMSEYQDIESLDRFLGSLRMDEPGQFVTQVTDNPFSLILLDEIEKAHKDILNIFLQVFDEGRLTDVFGRRISFEHNIIIATSNAGADYIRDLVKEGVDPSLEKEKVIDVLVSGGSFRPELLNRFDEVVVFHPLSREHVRKISDLMLGQLSKRLKEQGYEFAPTSELADFIAEAGFDPQFGARPMQRVIQDKVESAIARKILDGEIEKGKEFELGVDELE